MATLSNFSWAWGIGAGAGVIRARSVESLIRKVVGLWTLGLVCLNWKSVALREEDSL